MPSGKVHDAINLGVLAAVGGAAAALASTGALPWASLMPGAPSTYAVAGYLIGTFLITPDLDLADGHVSAKRRWGLLGWLWVPYGSVSRHRGRSHSWILGPSVRLIYLALIAGLILLGLKALNIDVPPLKRPGDGALWMIGGYFVSQWLHLIADREMPWRSLRPARSRGTKKRR